MCNGSGRDWVETRSKANSSTGGEWAEAVNEEQKRERGAGRNTSMAGNGLGADH